MTSLPALVIPPIEERDLGPHMKALNPRQRNFVIAYLQAGCRPKGNTQAARNAGYTGDDASMRVTAWRLMRDAKIQMAIKEEADKWFIGMAPLAMKALEDVVTTDGHKQQVKAAAMILDRTGYGPKTEHRVTMEKKEDRIQKLQRAIRVAKALGLDPKAFIGNASDVKEDDLKVIDADYIEVKGDPNESW